jgi:hypothetical protein
VANSHNGLARCLSSVSGGARFELILPVYTADFSAASCGTSSIKEPCHAEA